MDLIKIGPTKQDHYVAEGYNKTDFQELNNNLLFKTQAYMDLDFVKSLDLDVYIGMIFINILDFDDNSNVNVLNEYLPDNPAGGDYKVSFRANDFQMFETLMDLSGVYIDVNALVLSIRLKKTLSEGDFDLMEYLNSLNDPDLIEMFDILNLKLK